MCSRNLLRIKVSSHSACFVINEYTRDGRLSFDLSKLSTTSGLIDVLLRNKSRTSSTSWTRFSTGTPVTAKITQVSVRNSRLCVRRTTFTRRRKERPENDFLCSCNRKAIPAKRSFLDLVWGGTTLPNNRLTLWCARRSETASSSLADVGSSRARPRSFSLLNNGDKAPTSESNLEKTLES